MIIMTECSEIISRFIRFHMILRANNFLLFGSKVHKSIHYPKGPSFGDLIAFFRSYVVTTFKAFVINRATYQGSFSIYFIYFIFSMLC